MEVILTEDVQNLGLKGELHEVADGYARNFLIPQQKAVHASPRTKEQFKREQEEIEQRKQELRQEAEQVAEDLEGLSITLEKAASDEGSLYGSVTQEDLTDALADESFDQISPEQIIIDESIQEIGEHTFRVSLAGSVDVELEVEVVSS